VTDFGIVLLGAVLLTWPSNVVVRRVLRLARAGEGQGTGAGRWIGALERLLIFVLVMIGEAGAAGLVVAAKSILRYPEITGESPAIQPEYVLVGSLTSWFVGFAISAGVVELLG
jgi:hypothetical protein